MELVEHEVLQPAQVGWTCCILLLPGLSQRCRGLLEPALCLMAEVAHFSVRGLDGV